MNLESTRYAKRVGTAFAVAVALAFSAPAKALVIIGVAENGGEAVTYIDSPLGPGYVSSSAGQLLLTLDNGTVIPTWCVDFNHKISLGPVSYPVTAGPLTTDNTGSTSGTSNALSKAQIDNIGRLAAYGNLLMLTPLAPPTGFVAGDKNALSASIQEAIWEVEYPLPSLKIDKSSSGPNSAAFLTDLAMLEALLPTLPLAAGIQLSILDAQGQFLNQGTFEVPEPASTLLCSVGLLALAGMRRRARS